MPNASCSPKQKFWLAGIAMTGAEKRQNSKDRALDKNAQAQESQRIGARRECLGWPDRKVARYALALSGGGIRSATFSLGVVQALARNGLDGQPVSAPPADTSSTPQGDDQQPEHSWLARFDYLSTVSGGGYLGAFLCSLFVPGRFRKTPDNQSVSPLATNKHDKKPDSQEAARLAYRVLRIEPPSRLSPSRRIRGLSEESEKPPGLRMPLAWLRDNGRYLTPGGAGDAAYGFAVALRGVLTVHFAVGCAIVVLFSLAALAGAWLTERLPGVWPMAEPVLCSQQLMVVPDAWWPGRLHVWVIGPACPASAVPLPLSPWWALAALIVLAWVLPAVLAYWLAQLPRGFEIVVSLVLLVLLIRVVPPLAKGELPALLQRLGTVGAAVLGVIVVSMLAQRWWAWVKAYRQVKNRISRQKKHFSQESDATLRVELTRALQLSLVCLVGVLVLALGDSIGRGLHLHLQDEQPLTLASIGALLASAIALVRKLAVLFDEKSAGGWLARLPLPALAGVGALLTGLLWLALWSLFVQWTLARLSGSEPWLLVGAMLLTVGFGYWRGWLDLTSLRPFYERRLVRAYLGATNRVRFQSQDAAAYSSAEPIAGDDLNFDACLRTQGAPLHLINVTLNQTVGPGERLVQLDRKGKPLCVRPALEQPFLLEGQPCRFEKAPAEVGYWTALSGAAFSTGIGRLTSPGLSWLCGMANIRLGSWLRLKDQGKEPPWTTCLPTFTLLANEWRGHFHGSHGNWQYLSDGGHFENLGIYELLRPGRDVRLIIACDCGADPDYQFEDLANLVRLARVDFALEIEVDEEAMAVLQPAAARRVFASPQQLRQAELARRAGRRGALRRAEPGLSAADHRRPVLRRPAMGELPQAGAGLRRARGAGAGK